MRKTKEQKAITLIALIITVVVLLVLAVVTIRAVQGDGIITHANDAKAEHVIAQEKEKITLALNQAYLDGKGQISKTNLSNALKAQFGEDYIDDETSDEFVQVKLSSAGRAYKVYLNGQINGPDEMVEETPPSSGGGDDTTVSQAQFDAEFAEWAATNLDENATEFEYGDYVYKLNQYYTGMPMPGFEWNSNPSQGGWGVWVKDTTQQSYGMILSTALGAPVNTLRGTYNNCRTLTNIPNIPETITNMSMTFQGCSALTSLPEDFTIPSGVTDVGSMFSGCSALTSLPADFIIPTSVTSVVGMFSGCSALTSLPDGITIPNSVTNARNMFSECTLLESLPNDFKISDNATDLYRMFYNCASLTSLPEDFTIPSGATEVNDMFNGCTLLTGTIIINSTNIWIGESINGYSGCFSGTTQPITLTTTAGVSVETLNLIAVTAESGNVTVSVP